MIRAFRIFAAICALTLAAAAQSLPDAPSQSRRPATTATRFVSRPTLTARPGVVYQPLTRRQKFDLFAHHTYSPLTLANALYTATYAQATGDPYEYGGGMEGWGKRLGAAAAGTETRSFLGAFLFPSLLHQDPRYFAMYEGSKRERVLHALSRVVRVRTDDGNQTINTSGLLTIAFSEALATAWVPEGQRSVGTTFSRMAGALQGDATTYLLREFTPDLQRLFRRHCPRKLKKIEEKIPPQITGMPRGD